MPKTPDNVDIDRQPIHVGYTLHNLIIKYNIKQTNLSIIRSLICYFIRGMLSIEFFFSIFFYFT